MFVSGPKVKSSPANRALWREIVRNAATRSVQLGGNGAPVRSVTNGRWSRPVGVLLALLLGAAGVVVAAPAQADVCASGGNAIACENSKAGNPASDWETTGNGDAGLDGYTTDISTNVGGTVSFKIHSEANYTLDIYRMGYYGGDGARKITSLTPNQAVSQANLPSA